MFQNYSQTYAANITALAGFIVLMLNQFHITGIDQSGLEIVIGSLLSLGGFIWQFVQRYKKGGVTPLGSKA